MGAEPNFPVPSDETARLVALDRYDVLAGPPLPDLESVVGLAAYLCGVPKAVINMIAADAQHQIAAAGFEPAVTPRCDSMCAISIMEPDPVVVPDASRDPRFAANPFVTGVIDTVRFYAASQLRDPTGHVLGTLCVFDRSPRELDAAQRDALDRLARVVVDVLELRRHAELVQSALTEVRAGAAELARSNAALQDFAGQVSHDLKNPLTGVLGFVATLADLPAVAADPDARRCLDRALSSATRMWRMIDDVLSHASAGGTPYVTTVPLADTVRHVLDDLDPAITTGGATVRLGPLPTVLGDPTQLRVLLQNVIGNAVKFRCPDRPCEITVDGADTDDGWVLRVADNGVGIPAADRQRVLDMFTRLRPEVEGSGIGLATVRRIVAAHHADLDIGETPGGGTMITVRLPNRPLGALREPVPA